MIVLCVLAALSVALAFDTSTGAPSDPSAIHAASISAYNLTDYPASYVIAGGAVRTDQTFSDLFDIDVISPTPYAVTVDVNLNPQGPYVVSDMGGQPWFHINPYSWKITLNDTGKDFLGSKLEMSYKTESLKLIGIQADNTYVGKLSDDGTYWSVSQKYQNIHHSENYTRAVFMTELAGEWALLGRYTVDVADWIIQYGYYPFEATRTFNVTSGNSLTNGIFVDRFQLQIASPKDFGLNANPLQPITDTMPNGYTALTPYYYHVNTSAPGTAVRANVQLPFTPYMLETTGLSGDSLKVAYSSDFDQRYSVIPCPQFVDWTNRYVIVSNVSCVDGNFVVVGTH